MHLMLTILSLVFLSHLLSMGHWILFTHCCFYFFVWCFYAVLLFLVYFDVVVFIVSHPEWATPDKWDRDPLSKQTNKFSLTRRKKSGMGFWCSKLLQFNFPFSLYATRAAILLSCVWRHQCSLCVQWFMNVNQHRKTVFWRMFETSEKEVIENC